MQSSPVKINKKRQKFVSDPSRVLAKFYIPGNEDRIKNIKSRVLSLSASRCREVLQTVLDDFAGRHHGFEDILQANYGLIKSYAPNTRKRISKDRQLLMGAYFTHEYSVESAALFNPSIVPHPNQSDLPVGSTRFIISLRAIGEGHISSIVFRSGILDINNKMNLDAVSPFVEVPQVELNPTYDRHTFLLKLEELEAHNEFTDQIFRELPDHFLFDQLKESIEKVRTAHSDDLALRETIEIIDWIPQSNYSETFRKDSLLSERVVFPNAADESNGIEDARFVCFREDNGDIRYYATYTAYNGHTILPMLLETKDFLKFNMCTLNGAAARDKGMALFPRKVNGMYTMISRQDGENLYIMQSDNLHFWQKFKPLVSPSQSWEFIQVGNCGSPIELEQGWLLLTHGVGPLRKYCIGALLLDLNDPSKIIGKLKKPLIVPNEYEREGYVPNVVYTCGALLHNEILVIPYAISDTSSGVATVRIKNVLDNLARK